MDYIDNIDVLRGKVEWFIHETGKAMRLKRIVNPRANVLKEARLINQLGFAIDELLAGTELDATISYIISLIPDLDLIPATPFNPAVLDVLTSIPAPGGDTESDEDIIVTTEKVGGYKKNDKILAGTEVWDAFKRLVTEVYDPAIVAPSASMTCGLALAKINSNINVNLTITFNRGSIQNQGFRSGPVTGYEFDGTPQDSNTKTISGYNVVRAANTFYGAVSWSQGPQPLKSDGSNYLTPYPAGETELSTSFEGVYPIYADNVEQPLISMIHGNNVELALIAESGDLKQSFEVPAVWLTDRPLAKIEFFNTFSNQWDSTNKIANFAQTNVVRDGVSYIKFTSTDPSRGAIKIKLIF